MVIVELDSVCIVVLNVGNCVGVFDCGSSDVLSVVVMIVLRLCWLIDGFENLFVIILFCLVRWIWLFMVFGGCDRIVW